MTRVLITVFLVIVGCSLLSAQDVASTYAARCAHCHGADGGGNTPLGRAMKIGDLRSAEAKRLSPLEAASIIATGTGRGRMPGFEKKVGTEMVVQLAAYVRNIEAQPILPQMKPAPRQVPAMDAGDAKSVYQAKCAHCHGADGSGDTILGRRMKLRDMRSPEVQRYSATDLATIIGSGTDWGRMPGFQKKLGPEMVQQLAYYVRQLTGGSVVAMQKEAGETAKPPALPEQATIATTTEYSPWIPDRLESAPAQETKPSATMSKDMTLRRVQSLFMTSGRNLSRTELVDLNFASKEMLMSLPGITEADALSIIGSRPYKSTLQFRYRNIIAPEKYAQIADLIVARRALQSAGSAADKGQVLQPVPAVANGSIRY